jgi:tRNA1(Val) A37 N6-methylase TrmN6
LNKRLPTEDLQASLTADEFLGGALSVLQPKSGFRAGIESVLLAASVPAEPGARLIEPGLGVGVAALCLLNRVQGTQVTGLEVEPMLAELARRNAARNGMERRLAVLEGDVAAPPPMLKCESFDHAFVNPPFFEDIATLPAADAGLARARRGAAGLLALWLGFCVDRLAEGGTMTVIHRAEQLSSLVALVEARAGALRIFPLWPRRGTAAKRVIVSARKGSRAPLALLPGLVLHEEDGRFTRNAEDVLRRGAPLLVA